VIVQKSKRDGKAIRNEEQRLVFPAYLKDGTPVKLDRLLSTVILSLSLDENRQASERNLGEVH
jgi:hypothetical protein